MQRTKTYSKKTAAVSAAFAVALSTGAFGMAINEAPQAAAQSVSTIDDTQQLNLNLHKRIGAETDQQATGEVMENVPGTAVEGVEYTLELVRPLNTAADWQAAAGITNASEATAWEGEGAIPARTAVTNDAGLANFTNLPKGLYKVSETAVPENSGLVPGQPFLVYLPMTNPDNNGWIYDVHAYPKNSEVTIEKTVEDINAQAGQDYTYTITTGVPSGTLTKYNVQDELHEALDAAGAEITVAIQDGATLTAGTHYNVSITGQNILVEFTQAGFDAIEAGDLVETTITTRTTEAVQHIPNDATLIVNNGSGDTETTSDDVHTYWGNLNINKIDGDSEAPLEGAVLQLLQCQAEGDGWVQVDGTEPLNVNGQTEWTTDADGAVTISGIHVTDYANNADDTTVDYCLLETDAPDGYVGNDALVHFELNRGDVDPETGAPTAQIQYTATIENFTDENRLPNTGGMGVGLLIALGALIIGGGAYAARRNSAKA